MILHEQRLKILAALKGKGNEGAKQAHQSSTHLSSGGLPPFTHLYFALDSFLPPVKPWLEQNCKVAKLMRNLGMKQKV